MVRYKISRQFNDFYWQFVDFMLNFNKLVIKIKSLNMNKLEQGVSALLHVGAAAFMRNFSHDWFGRSITHLSLPQTLLLGAGIYVVSRLIHRISTTKPFQFMPQPGAFKPSFKRELIISVLSGIATNLLFVGFTVSSAATGGAIALIALSISYVFKAIFTDEQVLRHVPDEKIKFYGGLEIDFLLEKVPVNGNMTISAKEVCSIKTYEEKKHQDCIPYIYSLDCRPMITFLSNEEFLIVEDRCKKMNIKPPISLYDKGCCQEDGTFQACIPTTTDLFGYWIHLVGKGKSCFQTQSPYWYPKNGMSDFAKLIDDDNIRYLEDSKEINVISLVWQGEKSQRFKTREDLRILIELLEHESESEKESIDCFMEYMGASDGPMKRSFNYLRPLKLKEITPLGIRWIKLREKFRLKYEKQKKDKKDQDLEPKIALMYKRKYPRISFFPESRRQDIIDLCKKIGVKEPLFIFDEKYQQGVDLEKLPCFNALITNWINAYDSWHSPSDLFCAAESEVPSEELKTLTEYAKDHAAPPRLVKEMRRQLMSKKYVRKELSSVNIQRMREYLDFYQVLAAKIAFSENQQYLEPVLYRDTKAGLKDQHEGITILCIYKERHQEINELCNTFKVSSPVFLFDINQEEFLKLTLESLPDINSNFIHLIQSYDFGHEGYFRCHKLESDKPRYSREVSIDEMGELVELAQKHKNTYSMVSICLTPLMATLHGMISRKELPEKHPEKYFEFLVDLIRAYPKEAASYSLELFPEKDHRFEVFLCFNYIKNTKNMIIPKVLQMLILQKLFVQYLVDDL